MAGVLVSAPANVRETIPICSSARRINGAEFVFSKSHSAELEKFHAVLFGNGLGKSSDFGRRQFSRRRSFGDLLPPGDAVIGELRKVREHCESKNVVHDLVVPVKN
jgi:hypothetical protein